MGSGGTVKMGSMTGTNLIGEVHKMRREMPLGQQFRLLESREENLVFLVGREKEEKP